MPLRRSMDGGRFLLKGLEGWGWGGRVDKFLVFSVTNCKPVLFSFCCKGVFFLSISSSEAPVFSLSRAQDSSLSCCIYGFLWTPLFKKNSLIFSLSPFFPLPFIWRGISAWDAARLCLAKMLLLFVSPHPSCHPLCPPCFLPACVYNTCCGMDVWVGAGTYWQLPGNRLVHHFIMAQSP